MTFPAWMDGAKAKFFHESGRMEKADSHQTTSGQRDDYVCWIVACHGVEKMVVSFSEKAWMDFVVPTMYLRLPLGMS